MTDDPFDSEVLAVIERLQRAPQPRLTPTVFDNIRGQVLESVQPAPTPTRRLHRWPLGLVAAAFMLIVLVVIILANRPRPQPEQIAALGTFTPTDTVIVTVTRTDVPPTAKPFQATTMPSPSPSATEQPPPMTNAPLPSASPTMLASAPTNNPDAIIVVEGRVQSIKSNQVTVYDIIIHVAPENPILKIIKVGDFIRVKGSLSFGGELNAIQVSNVIDQPVNGATVLLDGRVQDVQNNIVTINGIDVQLATNDLTLKTIKVGTFLSITGNFERHGTTTVLVAVTVVIINDGDVVTYLQCKNLKAMGMGMGDNAMGMGMGDDGMGMGMGLPNCP